MHGLAAVLYFAAIVGTLERDPAKVERLASELIELCTRQGFALCLAGGEVLRGWARSVSGGSASSIAWIEDGIRDFQVPGGKLSMPYLLALNASSFLTFVRRLINTGSTAIFYFKCSHTLT